MKYRIVLILTIILGNQVLAQDLETDRPDQTEASSAIPKGTIQIETGLGIETLNNSFASERSFVLPTTLFRLAVVNKFELRVVNTLRANKSTSAFGFVNKDVGFDDVELGFKWQWTDGNGWSPQIALMSHVALPTGSKSSNKYGLINKLLISHDVSDKFAIGYNLGHVYYGAGNGDFVYSLALGFSVTDKIGVYAETFGSMVDLQTFDSNIDAGMTYLLKDNIQLDYSFGVGIHQRMNYQAIGLTIRLPQ